MVKYLIVLILALNGCNKEDIIATTAKESNVEFVSTNAININPDIDTIYFAFAGELDSETDTYLTLKNISVINNRLTYPLDQVYNENYPSPRFRVGNKLNYNKKDTWVFLNTDLYLPSTKVGMFDDDLYYIVNDENMMCDDGKVRQVSAFWNTTLFFQILNVTDSVIEHTYSLEEFAALYPGLIIVPNELSQDSGNDWYAVAGKDVLIGEEAFYSGLNSYNGKGFKDFDEVFTRVSASNRYKAIDSKNTSVTTAEGLLYYKIKSPNSFNSFTLAGVTAESLNYTIKDSGGTVVKTGTVVLDCYLDDDKLLPQGEVTLLISAGELVESNGTVEITLTNTGTVKLGSFFTNIAIDEGITELSIKAGFRDTNSYDEDHWGEISESIKPITKKFDITVLVPYAKFTQTYGRHKSFLGKFITLDTTDSILVSNGLTLHALVARGIIISVGHETLVKDNDMEPHYRYSMSFLEIV